MASGADTGAGSGAVAEEAGSFGAGDPQLVQKASPSATALPQFAQNMARLLRIRYVDANMLYMPDVQENPLHKKLRLRSGDTGLIISPPQGDDNPLLPLPEGFTVLESLADLASSEGQFEYLHVFARDKAGLADAFGQLRDKLSPGGNLWVSWVKVAGKRGGGQAIDLNDNVIRRLALTHGLVDVKVAALDRDWSALLLVHRKR
jgi:hypothetical protein